MIPINPSGLVGYCPIEPLAHVLTCECVIVSLGFSCDFVEFLSIEPCKLLDLGFPRLAGARRGAPRGGGVALSHILIQL